MSQQRHLDTLSTRRRKGERPVVRVGDRDHELIGVTLGGSSPTVVMIDLGDPSRRPIVRTAKEWTRLGAQFKGRSRDLAKATSPRSPKPRTGPDSASTPASSTGSARITGRDQGLQVSGSDQNVVLGRQPSGRAIEREIDELSDTYDLLASGTQRGDGGLPQPHGLEGSSPRTFRTTVTARPSEIGGLVRYTITEKITPRHGGVEVQTHAEGIAEGERVDQRSLKFHPGVSLDAAAAYRLRNGYHEI